MFGLAGKGKDWVMTQSLSSKAGRAARSTLMLFGLLGGTAVAGCITGPYTGYLQSTTPAGQKITFQGRADNSAPAVSGYVLSNANTDPLQGAWTKISSNVTINGPYTDPHDTAPYWEWSFVSSTMTSTQWPSGGLARFKGTGKYNGNSTPGPLVTFDNESLACVWSPAEINNGWRQQGQDCQTPYYDGSIITAVATDLFPSDVQDIKYLGRGGGHAFQPGAADDPLTFLGQTIAYYHTIQAPNTLGEFKTKFGFDGVNETHAIYYNVGDLGIARDMHCRKTATNVTACYVTNYGRATAGVNPPPIFGTLDPQTAINQAINGFNGNQSFSNTPVATVAMVQDPGNAANKVQFMVFNKDGDLDNYAALDNPGLFAINDAEHFTPQSTTANINVPDNCLTCHGAGATYTRSETDGVPAIANAFFLPFDKQSFIFSTQNSTYSEANTMVKLKSLNTLVWNTVSSTSAIGTLLKGMYPLSGVPTGPQDPGTSFDTTYVPAGWNNNKAQREVYNEVVKPYCRTCHVTAHSYYDWDTFTEMSQSGPSNDVCGGINLPMPQAEQVQNRMWNSAARAHFVAGFQLSGACDP